MLSDNIRTLRKQKGYSQETLAERLHVVRQTVSKWEKGLSVPDAELLQALADVLEVSVSDLLGEKILTDEAESQENEISNQLAILNDRLANQSIKRKKFVCRSAIGAAAAVFVVILIYLLCFFTFSEQPTQNAALTTTAITCELNDEAYYYEVTYDENYQICYVGGDDFIADHFIADHVETEKYGNSKVLIAQIKDYFTERGGRVKITETDSTVVIN